MQYRTKKGGEIDLHRERLKTRIMAHGYIFCKTEGIHDLFPGFEMVFLTSRVTKAKKR